MEIDFSLIAEQDADAERQAAWRERNVKEIAKARKRRLKWLDEERPAIARALREYSVIDNPDVPWINFRRPFVRLNVPRMVGPDAVDEPRELSNAAQARERTREVATRPPLARLLHRQSKALSLYLTAVYVAHLETAPGSAFYNNRKNSRGTEEGLAGWTQLGGMITPQDSRSQRARIRRALDELVAAGLVSIGPPSKHYRYEGWNLRADDGTGSDYVVPGERDATGLSLPASFFLHGWHLVLTPGEIAMLFAITQMNRLFGGITEPGANRYWLALPQSVRRRRYGLSGEIYLNAQQLLEFGLVEFKDPMPTRRRGKISDKHNPPLPAPPDSEAETGAPQTGQEQPKRLPYQWAPAESTCFDRMAFEVVHATLTALPVPSRLTDSGLFSSPQEHAQAILRARRMQQSR
jgi:hypothetical protein